MHGPLAALRADFDFVYPEPQRSMINYVNGLFVCSWMYGTRKSCESQSKIKNLYDGRTERHEFRPGDQVLAAIPIIVSLFQAKYRG